LPARVRFVDLDLDKTALIIGFDCFGSPDLRVAWFPKHDLQRVPANWVVAPAPNFRRASIPVPKNATAAELTLFLGGLQADVSSVSLKPSKVNLGVAPNTIHLEVMREKMTAPGFPTSKAPNQEHGSETNAEGGEGNPPVSVTPTAFNLVDHGRRKPTGIDEHSKIDPEVAKRRTIVKQNSKLKTIGICQLLDEHNVSLPPGLDWEPFRSHTTPWTVAYRQGGEKLRHRIRVIIAKDKKA
jgi:hypothetical protein